MADGGLILTLSDELAARLRVAAQTAGIDVETFAREHLEAAVAEGPRHDTTEALRRLAEYDRTGEYIELEDWIRDFEAEVEARYGSKL